MVLRIFIAAFFILSAFSTNADAFFGRRGGRSCGGGRMCGGGGSMCGGGRSCGMNTSCGGGGCGVVRSCSGGSCSSRPVCGGGRSCGGGNRFADSGVFTGDQFGGGFPDNNQLQGVGGGINAAGSGQVVDPTVGGGQIATNQPVGNSPVGSGAGFVPTNVGSGPTPQSTTSGGATTTSATAGRNIASATVPSNEVGRHLVNIPANQTRNGRGGMGVVIDPTDPNLSIPRQIFLKPNGQPFVQGLGDLSPELTAELARRYNASRGVQRSPEEAQLINRFLQFANQGSTTPVQPIGAVAGDGQSPQQPGGGGHAGGGAGDANRPVDQDSVFQKWAKEFNTAENAATPEIDKVSGFVGKYRSENEADVAALYQECTAKSDPTKKVPATVFLVNKERDGKKVPAITITAGHTETDSSGKLKEKAVATAKKYAHVLSATEAKPEAGLYASEIDWEAIPPQEPVTKEVYLKKLKDADANGKPQYVVQLVLKRAPTKAKEIGPNDEVYYCKRTPAIEKKDPEQKKGETTKPEEPAQPQMTAGAIQAFKACASCHKDGSEGVGFLKISEDGEVKYVGDRTGEEITSAQLADAIANGGMAENAIGKLKKAGMTDEQAKHAVEDLRKFMAGETAPKKAEEATTKKDEVSPTTASSDSSWLDTVQGWVSGLGDAAKKVADDAAKAAQEKATEAESYEP